VRLIPVPVGLAAIACGMVMMFGSPAALPGSALATASHLNWQLLAGILTVLAGGVLLQFHRQAPWNKSREA
jgi:hypothetical protein